jgi:hypothetical protein
MCSPCDLCSRVFFSPQALGGHRAKKHSGCSPKYTAKTERYKERTAERELHRRAKVYFIEVNGFKPTTSNRG